MFEAVKHERRHGLNPEYRVFDRDGNIQGIYSLATPTTLLQLPDRRMEDGHGSYLIPFENVEVIA